MQDNTEEKESGCFPIFCYYLPLLFCEFSCHLSANTKRIFDYKKILTHIISVYPDELISFHVLQENSSNFMFKIVAIFFMFFTHLFLFLGKYPIHIKPESWLIYNEKHGCSRGLFFMDGEEWLQYRRIMNNILLKGDLSWIDNACKVASDIFIDQINMHLDKEFPNLDDELYKWSMDVMVAVLVGADTYKTSCRDLEDLVKKLAAKVFLVFETTVNLQLLPAKLAEKYNIGRWKRFEQSVTEALEAANEVLKYVQSNFEETDGLLQKMIISNVDQEAMAKIVIDMMLGAADTTANTLAWSFYLLGKDTTIQSQLREDLKNTEKSPLVRNIFRETLRLYPPAAFLTRFLPEAATVYGYNIPASTLIVMSIYTSGRDSKYFKDPNEFLPNRWLRENSTGFPKVSASLPFGIGVRSCIGKRIAEVQLQDVLEKTIGNFKLNLKNEGEIEDVLKMITKPSKPIRLVLNKL